jgi:molybdopterin-guanine dinucleotide biosynthesis protein A
MRRVIAGVLVGGQGSRMGGAPKGLLRTPSGETIVERWAAIFDRLGLDRVLVGVRSEYAALGWRSIEDDAAARGPLAGLLALLSDAGEGHAIAVACDMPYVSDALVSALLAAAPAPIVAPRQDDRWQPLFARYDAPRVLPLARAQAHAGQWALQSLLDRAGAVELALDDAQREQLRDWDVASDIE